MGVKLDAGIHYRKSYPLTESHVLVHAYDGDGSHSGVIDNTTAVPNQGNFVAAPLFSDTVLSQNGHFVEVPDSSVMMTNGTDTVIWSGTEARCPAFLVSDSALATVNTNNPILYDFTDAVNEGILANKATLYDAADGNVYVYIGSIRPLKGVKFYPYHTNTAASSVAVNYWSGTGWTPVTTLADGTVTGSASLAKSGSVTFDDTTSVAKIGLINNSALYFYQFIWTGLEADHITLTRCTVSMAPQLPVDIWDGTMRPLSHAFVGKTSDIPETDASVNIFSQNHVPGDMTTQLQLTNIGGYLHIGFLEPMMGFRVVLPVGNTNSTSGSVSVCYWNGTAWVGVSNLVDGTLYNNVSFGTTGWITWTPPAAGLEQTKAYTGGPQYYYYRLSWGSYLDSGHWIDYIGGLPKPHTLTGYSTTAMWQNRTILAGPLTGMKNKVLISAYGSSCVFNGADAVEITDIGDNSPPTAMGALFTRYTGQFYDTLVICKAHETWVLDGTSAANYHLYKVSDKYGCVAPETFKIVNISYEIATGIARQVAIWLSASGVVLYDGNTICEIDQDIKNYFQSDKKEFLNIDTITRSAAFVDEREREYHLLVQSSNSASESINTELVYSTKRKAWFKIERGSTLYLQSGFTAYSTLGVPYTYAGTATGLLERLEDQDVTTFDGVAISHTIKTRDIPFSGWLMETLVRYIKLVTRPSTVNITVSHFGDGNKTADASTIIVNPVTATKDFVQGKGSVNWGNSTFHSFKIANTTPGGTPTALFEPVALVGLYQEVGIDRRST
jgi:hypothetical protein